MNIIGELNFFIGIQVKQTKNEIFISQSEYARELAKKFWMEGKSHACTLMSTLVKISVDPIGEIIYPNLYRIKIGCLLYLVA